jgi:PAS domain S-box-containing protein
MESGSCNIKNGGFGLDTAVALQNAVGFVAFNVSRDCLITAWNRAAEILYGVSSADILSAPFSKLWLNPSEMDDYFPLERIFEGESIEAIDCKHVSASGRTLQVRLCGEPLRNSQGEIGGALVTAWDRTEYYEIKDQLSAMSMREYSRSVVFATASQVALDILSNRMGVEALKHIADAARTLAGARYAALGVARSDGLGLVEFVTVGMSPEEEAMIGALPTGKGLLGHLLQSTSPIRLDDMSKHSSSVGFPPNHPVMKSFLGVPIRRGDQVLGSLYLADKIGSLSFSDADEDAVQSLGAHAAVAIHNLQLLSRQKALVSGLIMAQEEERRAVAYDLHDGLTQFVMASHAHLEAFKRATETGDSARAAKELDSGLGYLKDAVIESRRLVNGLRSLALDDLGLAGALEQVVNDEKNRGAWEDAEFIHNITGHRFDKALETAVYRVAQEAITNARKHAETTRVRLVLLLSPSQKDSGDLLTLEVRDWGKGFAPEEKVGEYNHLGLHGMIERVSLMGGTYDLESRLGEGTRIRATFPVLGHNDNPLADDGESGDDDVEESNE